MAAFDAYVKSNKVKFGTVWIDVEPCTGCWIGTAAQNADVVVETVKALQTLKYTVGIYANPWSWTAVTGNANVLGQLPIWCASIVHT